MKDKTKENKKQYMKEYCKKNRENIKKQRAEHYIKNKKRLNKLNREWKEKNKEEIKEYGKKYRQEHKEEGKEWNKKWIKEHPNWRKEYEQRPEVKKRRKEYNKKWEEENKEKRKELAKEYHQRPEVKKRTKEYQQRPERKEYGKRYYDKILKNKGFCKDCGKKINKTSLRCLSCANKGRNNPSWRGGVQYEPYDKAFDNKFRRAIRKRDNQICMMCGIHSEKLKRALCVHHINGDKQISIFQNCVSLCMKCHSLIHKDKNKSLWIKHFQNLLSKEYDYEYSKTNEIILNLNNLKNETRK